MIALPTKLSLLETNHCGDDFGICDLSKWTNPSLLETEHGCGICFQLLFVLDLVGDL